MYAAPPPAGDGPVFQIGVADKGTAPRPRALRMFAVTLLRESVNRGHQQHTIDADPGLAQREPGRATAVSSTFGATFESAPIRRVL